MCKLEQLVYTDSTVTQFALGTVELQLTTDYTLAIPHEVQCIACHVWDVYPQELLVGLRVPHTYLTFRTGGKTVGIGTVISQTKKELTPI